MVLLLLFQTLLLWVKHEHLIMQMTNNDQHTSPVHITLGFQPVHLESEKPL